MLNEAYWRSSKAGCIQITSWQGYVLHLSNPGEEHWHELGRLVGYLRQKKNLNLIYRKPRELRSTSQCDSNYAKDPNDRKSISGRINTVGGKLSNWTSKKQGAVTLSSTKQNTMP